MKPLFVCKPSERGDEIATNGHVVPENKEYVMTNFLL